MKFGVKRHWWMWGLCVLWHLVAARFFAIGFWQVLAVLLAADFFLIFPEASHYSYDITNRQFTAKRAGYSDISFPVSAITAVENATLFTAWGGRSSVINMNQIIEWAFGTYKIIYNANAENHSRKSVLICPKNRKEFLNELRRHVDPEVILINNTESAFKKKKDKL